MKPELGVCYYPEHWPESMWATDAWRMKETGLSWVRIGEFAWSRLETREGTFTWEWLDRAVATLGEAGLKVVMGTPSATPPKWVIDKYPDMLAVDNGGQKRTFGSRRHYCFSHIGYRKEAARMAAQMAHRYGQNRHIHAWQIDNEYGCHNTVLSFSKSALLGFRQWLTEKYKSPAALNHAWGNVFWSMEYASFDDIDLPNQTVTEANPSHWMDFRRYASDQIIVFNSAQVEAISPYTDKPLTHNYMGRITDFDHFNLGSTLEIASWDSYPLGFLEQCLSEETEEWKAAFSRQGDPDFQAFHHDLYRVIGKGRLWVMEQQPGPVNWAPYNPAPLHGMVKLWTMEAIAHGAEVVSYFRWRQVPFAQEQMHTALLQANNIKTRGHSEICEVAQELKTLGDIQLVDADIAIVFDYESQWSWETQPHGKNFDYFRLVFEQYRALRKLGLNVDFISSQERHFRNYKLVLIPGLMAWNKNIETAIAQFKGQILCGPRTGLKTADFQIAENTGAYFAGTKVTQVESIRPNLSISLELGGRIIHWYEKVETDTIIEKSVEAMTVLSGHNGRYYLSAWLDQDGYTRIFNNLCKAVGIKTLFMPEGVRRRSAKPKDLVMNYNSEPVEFEGQALGAASYKWM